MIDDTRTRRSDVQSPKTILPLPTDSRRRYAVAALVEREAPVALRDLAAAVAAAECETPPDDVPSDRVDEVATALHHVHAPKLDDAGLVDYDAEANVVVRTRTEELESFVESHEAIAQF